MDLKAANLADERAWRLTRFSLICCFVLASGMLIASLAMAHGVTEIPGSHDLTTSSISR